MNHFAEPEISEAQHQLLCAHCGLPASESIEENGLHFCCHGCKTAHTFLADFPVCEIPGQQNPLNESELHWLDNPEVLQKFLIGKQGNAVRVRLQIPNIHCASCVQVLEHLYRKKHGILASQVNFLKKEIEISFQPEVLTFSELAQYLNGLGYAPSLSAPESRKRISESLLWTLRMAVAGFCAGNIMLLSFPEYLGLDDVSYRHFFGWINLALAMPAVFFSGWIYLESVYRAVTKRVLNIDVPIGVGMIATLILSIYEIVSQTGAGYLDSLTGLIFFLLIGRWVQNQTFQFLSFERDFRSYFPLSILRLEGEREVSILSTDIKSGDKLRIRHGEIVPCDGVLMYGDARIDYSFVSGESDPIVVLPGERLMAGGKQTSGSLVMVAEKEMSRSQLVTLWNNPVFQKEGKPGMRTFSDQVAFWFTPIILAVAIGVAVFWAFQDPSKSLHSFLAVLIIACPCTLSLAYPMALGNTMRLWGKTGFFLKNADVVERLAQTNTLVFDKTGTLTNSLGVAVSFEGFPLADGETKAIAAVLSASHHPLSQAVAQYLHVDQKPSVVKFREEKGQGVSGEADNLAIRAGSASFVGLLDEKAGGSRVHISINGSYRGVFRITSAPQPFVESMLKRLSLTFNLHLLSGDHEEGQNYWRSLFSGLSGTSRFSQKPDSKLNYIQSLQKTGARVAMVGDGLNDAGALRQADAGIAIASTAHQFTPGSDAILLAEKLSFLPRYFQHAKRTMIVVRFCFFVSVVYNVIGLSYAIQGDLQPIVAAILMPVNSLTVVFLAWMGAKISAGNFTQSEVD